MAALTDGRALDRTTDLTQGALQDIDNVVAIIEASSMSASAKKRALDSLWGATDKIHKIETNVGKGVKSLVKTAGQYAAKRRRSAEQAAGQVSVRESSPAPESAQLGALSAAAVAAPAPRVPPAPRKNKKDTPHKSQGKQKKPKTLDDAVELPDPLDGRDQYTSLEAVQILAAYDKPGPIANAMVDQKRVPCKYARLMDITKKYKDSNGKDVPGEFGASGKQAFVTVEQVDQWTEDLKGGRAGNEDLVKEKLKEARAHKLKSQGYSTLGMKSPSKNTVKNYAALAAMGDDAIVRKKVQPKTDTRVTAERSIISATCLAVTVAHVHCYPVPESLVPLHEKDCKLAKMVSIANGDVPVTH